MKPEAHFNLKSPCADCPFRNDITPFIRASRAKQILDDIILDGDTHFHCHKTVKYLEDGHDVTKSQLCAGAMILQEKSNRPSVMARLGAVFGYYDRAKLNMDAPVYDTPEEMIAAHEKQERKEKGKWQP